VALPVVYRSKVGRDLVIHDYSRNLGKLRANSAPQADSRVTELLCRGQAAREAGCGG
jgi:hypothetical protein